MHPGVQVVPLYPSSNANSGTLSYVCVVCTGGEICVRVLSPIVRVLSPIFRVLSPIFLAFSTTTQSKNVRLTKGKALFYSPQKCASSGMHHVAPCSIKVSGYSRLNVFALDPRLPAGLRGALPLLNSTQAPQTYSRSFLTTRPILPCLRCYSQQRCSCVPATAWRLCHTCCIPQ